MNADLSVVEAPDRAIMDSHTLDHGDAVTNAEKSQNAAFVTAVMSTLDRILRSKDFRASRRNRRFLHRIVEMELDGRGEEISGYLIGSEVFRRGKSFDHVKDPIVRIEATKLRRDLEYYYLAAGRNERIVITIPKGGYRPHFEEREQGGAATGGSAVLDAAGLTVASVRATGALASAQPPLRARLADCFAKDSRCSVFVAPEPEVALLDSDAVRRISSRYGTAFILSGDAWQDDGASCFVARLHDGATGRQLWSGEFRGESEGLAARVAAGVAEARGKFAVGGEFR